MEFTTTVAERYQKNAVLKREEGIGGPRNQSDAPRTVIAFLSLIERLYSTHPATFGRLYVTMRLIREEGAY